MKWEIALVGGFGEKATSGGQGMPMLGAILGELADVTRWYLKEDHPTLEQYYAALPTERKQHFIAIGHSNGADRIVQLAKDNPQYPFKLILLDFVFRNMLRWMEPFIWIPDNAIAVSYRRTALVGPVSKRAAPASETPAVLGMRISSDSEMDVFARVQNYPALGDHNSIMHNPDVISDVVKWVAAWMLADDVYRVGAPISELTATGIDNANKIVPMRMGITYFGPLNTEAKIGDIVQVSRHVPKIDALA